MAYCELESDCRYPRKGMSGLHIRQTSTGHSLAQLNSSSQSVQFSGPPHCKFDSSSRAASTADLSKGPDQFMHSPYPTKKKHTTKHVTSTNTPTLAFPVKRKGTRATTRPSSSLLSSSNRNEPTTLYGHAGRGRQARACGGNIG